MLLALATISMSLVVAEMLTDATTTEGLHYLNNEYKHLTMRSIRYQVFL